MNSCVRRALDHLILLLQTFWLSGRAHTILWGRSGEHDLDKESNVSIIDLRIDHSLSRKVCCFCSERPLPRLTIVFYGKYHPVVLLIGTGEVDSWGDDIHWSVNSHLLVLTCLIYARLRLLLSIFNIWGYGVFHIFPACAEPWAMIEVFWIKVFDNGLSIISRRTLRGGKNLISFCAFCHWFSSRELGSDIRWIFREDGRECRAFVVDVIDSLSVEL